MRQISRFPIMGGTFIAVFCVALLSQIIRSPSREDLDKRYQSALEVWKTKGEISRDEVREAMRPLASTKPGKASLEDAHLWMARDWQRKALQAKGPERQDFQQVATRHLEKAVKVSSAREDLVFALAGSHVKLGETSRAIQILSQHVNHNPGLSVYLAWLEDKYGNRSNAEKYAEIGRNHYSAIVVENPKDDDARVKWARAEMLLHEDGRVREILHDGKTISGPKKKFRNLEISLWQRQFLHSVNAKPPHLPEALKSLEEIALLSPKNWQPIARIVALVKEHPSIDTAAKTTLIKLQKKGAPALPIYISLGTLHMAKGEYGEAKLYLEKALELAPTNPNVLLQLARCHAKASPPNFQKALELLETGIKSRKSGNYLFRVERALLLLEQGKSQIALPELEELLSLSMKKSKIRTKVLQALAHGYEEAGDNKKAEYFRNILEKEEIMPTPDSPSPLH